MRTAYLIIAALLVASPATAGGQPGDGPGTEHCGGGEKPTPPTPPTQPPAPPTAPQKPEKPAPAPTPSKPEKPAVRAPEAQQAPQSRGCTNPVLGVCANRDVMTVIDRRNVVRALY